MPENMDKRVKYTRKALTESLFTLLKSKPISRITVKELCAMADINRGTFYAHFVDPQDLLSQVCSDASSALQQRLDTYLMLSPRPDAASLWRSLLQTFKDRPVFFQALLSVHEGVLFSAFLRSLLSQRCLPHLSASLSLQPPLPSLTLEFWSAGCTALIEKWVLSGCKVPVEEISSRLTALTLQTFKHDSRTL